MVDLPRSLPPSDAERLAVLRQTTFPGGVSGESRNMGPGDNHGHQGGGTGVGGGDSGGLDETDSKIDAWSIVDAATATFETTFSPLDDSWNLELNGLRVHRSEFTVDDQTVTILDPADLFLGADSQGSPWDLEMQYDYLTGVPVRPTSGDYFDRVMAANPLAYWRLGEASGTTMTDSSGNGRDGTYFNGPTLGEPSLLTDDPDTAAFFADASHEYGAAASASWMNTSEVTAMAVIEPHNVSSDRGILSRTSYPTGVLSWHFNVSGRALQFSVWIGGTRYTASTAPLVLDSVSGGILRTYHVAATYDGATMLVYLDGVQVASLAQAGAPDTGTAQISVGRTKFDVQADGNEWFEGVIDEAAVFGTALSAGDIAVIAAAR